jgi:pimeloyl-ACP methyl ester carboxylesterase
MKIKRGIMLGAAAAALAAVPAALAMGTRARRKANKATYVLVHGGGHGGWCYQFVADLLRAQGHSVYTPSLTGMAEHEHLLNPSIDLDTQIAGVVKLLHFEDLRDVILVGHSYGGMVITGIADRAADRIGHLVYLDAANPVNGQSLVDVAGPNMAAARQGSRTIDGVELVLFPGTDPLGFYGVTDPGMIEWMKTRLTPHPWKCFEQKLVLTNEEALWAIPQTHIICTATIPGRDIDALKASSEGRVWDVDTGHDLMLTEPEKTAELLLRVAAL